MHLNLLLDDEKFMGYVLDAMRAMRQRKIRDADDKMPFLKFKYTRGDNIVSVSSEDKKPNPTEQKKALLVEINLLRKIIEHLQSMHKDEQCISFVRWYQSNLKEWLGEVQGHAKHIKFSTEEKKCMDLEGLPTQLQQLINDCTPDEKATQDLDKDLIELKHSFKINQNKDNPKIFADVQQRFRQLINKAYDTKHIAWFEAHATELKQIAYSNKMREFIKTQTSWKAMDMFAKFDEEYKAINYEELNIALTKLDTEFEKRLKANLYDKLKMNTNSLVKKFSDKAAKETDAIGKQVKESLKIAKAILRSKEDKNWLRRLTSWARAHPILAGFVGVGAGIAAVATGSAVVLASSAIAAELAVVTFFGVSAAGVASTTTLAVKGIKADKKNRQLLKLEEQHSSVQTSNDRSRVNLRSFQKKEETYDTKSADFDKKINRFDKKLNELQLEKTKLSNERLKLEQDYQKQQSTSQSSVKQGESEIEKLKRQLAELQRKESLNEIDGKIEALGREIKLIENEMSITYHEKLNLTYQLVEDAPNSSYFTELGRGHAQSQRELTEDIQKLRNKLKGLEQLRDNSFHALLTAVQGDEYLRRAIQDGGDLDIEAVENCLNALNQQRLSLSGGGFLDNLMLLDAREANNYSAEYDNYAGQIGYDKLPTIQASGAESNKVNSGGAPLMLTFK